MKWPPIALIATGAFLLCGAAQGDEPASAPSDEILVIGRAKIYTLDGKRLEAARRAFLADRSRFAPASTLWFSARATGGRPIDDIAFSLVRGGQIVKVPIDAQGRFVLPPTDLTGRQLVANRAPGEIGLRAWVLSPGASEADRSMGDVRLQCRVSWALQKERFSFVQRAGFDAIGGCASKRIDLWTTATRPLSSAELVGAGVKQALDLRNDGTRYHLPVADQAVPDAARLRLTFR